MTHTLHRRGDPSSLRGDYVLLGITCQTSGSRGSASKLNAFADIALKHDPVNFGDMKTGNMLTVGLDRVQASYRDNSIVHAVFTDEEKVVAVLKELKEAELGVSVVVTGLFEHTAACCGAAGLKPHTVAQSLGIFGKVDLLPREEVLQISTMCGHGLVAFALIEALAERVRTGDLTSKQAALEMARLCHCGIFNVDRAARILSRMVNPDADANRAGSSLGRPEPGGDEHE